MLHPVKLADGKATPCNWEFAGAVGVGTGTGGAEIGRDTTPSDELGRLGLSTRAVFRPLFKMSERASHCWSDVRL